MLFDGICGDLRVWVIHPVTLAIFKKISGVIPSGLLTSNTTSPVASSQKITDTVISLGKILVIASPGLIFS